MGNTCGACSLGINANDPMPRAASHWKRCHGGEPIFPIQGAKYLQQGSIFSVKIPRHSTRLRHVKVRRPE